MVFQPELGWSVLDLPGRFADTRCPAPLQKQETKRIGVGSPVVSPMLSRFFPVEEKINYLRNEVLCVSLCTFHRWVAWYL